MSWILMLLKNLPAIMAAIQTLISIFAVKAAMASHAAFTASAAAGVDLGADNWNWYVAGQGGGGAAMAVSAIVLACCQPTANAAFAAYGREQAAQSRRLRLLALEDEVASLPAGDAMSLAARAGR